MMATINPKAMADYHALPLKKRKNKFIPTHKNENTCPFSTNDHINKINSHYDLSNIEDPRDYYAKDESLLSSSLIYQTSKLNIGSNPSDYIDYSTRLPYPPNIYTDMFHSNIEQQPQQPLDLTLKSSPLSNFNDIDRPQSSGSSTSSSSSGSSNSSSYYKNDYSPPLDTINEIPKVENTPYMPPFILKTEDDLYSPVSQVYHPQNSDNLYYTSPSGVGNPPPLMLIDNDSSNSDLVVDGAMEFEAKNCKTSEAEIRRRQRQSKAFYDKLTEDERKERHRQLDNMRSRQYRTRRRQQKSVLMEELECEERRSQKLQTQYNELQSTKRAFIKIMNEFQERSKSLNKVS